MQNPVRTILAAALTISAGHAIAEEPIPVPQTDFTAVWDMQGSPEIAPGSRLSYSASLNRMRIDMVAQGQEMTMVREINGSYSVMWSSAMPGMAMQMDISQSGRDNGERSDRTDTVSGETCTIWITDKVEACVTDDGIPVRTISDGVTAIMTDIDRSAQDDARFSPPADLQVMQMPSGMPSGPGMGNVPLPF